MRLMTLKPKRGGAPRLGVLLSAERLLGRLDEAAQHARELVATRPDDVIAQSLHAQLLVDTNGDSQQALAAATKAVSLAEANARDRNELTTALDALGRAQLAAGKPTESEATFRRVLGLLPNSPSARLGLAETLMALDRGDEARRTVSEPTVSQAIQRSPMLQTRLDRLIQSLGR